LTERPPPCLFPTRLYRLPSHSLSLALLALARSPRSLRYAHQVLENPGWYTAYTPYSPEQSQGRLESLINYQTVASSLTGLPISNASLLDEATAAAEAMAMCLATTTKSANPKHGDKTFLVSDGVSPATQAVLRTRSKGFGITVRTVHDSEMQSALESAKKGSIIGIMLQYPDVNGGIRDYAELAGKAKAKGAKVVVASDLLALTLLKPPGEWGADVCLGNSARFGEFVDGRDKTFEVLCTHKLTPPSFPPTPAAQPRRSRRIRRTPRGLLLVHGRTQAQDARKARRSQQGHERREGV
jgi:glycine dehydrogenase